MFSGIVEKKTEIIEVINENSNLIFWLVNDKKYPIKVDQSISHNGICLTVEDIKDNLYRVTAIEETIKKSNILNWQKNQFVNWERCITLDTRLDGHLVQGHVDSTAICIEMKDLNGSIEFTFKINPKYLNLIIEKGSITIDGTSLTCHTLLDDKFIVSLIPYTLEHTIASEWRKGYVANIEFDIIGKYLNRNLMLYKSKFS